MLTSLIPGLREVRAPLLAGFLWLAVIWLWIDLPSRDEVESDGGGRASLLALGDAIGHPGLIAVATVAAYLIGSLSEEARTWLLERQRVVDWRDKRRARRGTYDTQGTELMSLRGQASVTEYLAQALRSVADEAHRKGFEDVREALGIPTDMPVADKVHVADWETLIPSAAAELYRELGVIRTRLRVSQEVLAAEADRLEAEATLRLAFAGPAIGLLVTLAIQDHPIWAAGILPVGALVWQGRQRLQTAGDVLADALLADAVRAPTIDRFAAQVESAQAKGSAQPFAIGS